MSFLLSIFAVIKELFSFANKAADAWEADQQRRAGHDAATVEADAAADKARQEAAQAEIEAMRTHATVGDDSAFDAEFKRKD